MDGAKEGRELPKYTEDDEDRLLEDSSDEEQAKFNGVENPWKRMSMKRNADDSQAKKAKIEIPVYTQISTSEEGCPASRKTLRGYQKEISSKVLNGDNDIIILPTGTGKTAVAANLVLQHLRQKQEKDEKVKVLFLVPRVVLVEQQLDVIKDYLGDDLRHTCKRMTGGDLDSMDTLKNLLTESEYSVIVATPGTVLNYFKAFRLSTMRDFSLIIFDECHNARGADPYNMLLKQFIKEKLESPDCAQSLPQLVGMTATVGIGGSKSRGEAKEYILSVCSKLGLTTLPASVEESKEELDAVVDQPMIVNEEVEEIRKDAFSMHIREIMSGIVKWVEEKLDLVKVWRAIKYRFKPKKELIDLSLVQTIKETIESLRLWMKENTEGTEANGMDVDEGSEATENDKLVADAKNCIQYLEHLKVYRQALVWANVATLKDSLDYIKEEMENDKLRKCELFKKYTEEWSVKLDELADKESDYPNKKLLVLKKELDKVLCAERIDDNYSPKVMVFVEHRRLAMMISDWLKSQGPQYNSERFVSSQQSTLSYGMTASQAKDVTEKFREGDLNILVATSVLSEGYDIPECNCVIRYMYIKDVIAEVQVPGRVRSKNGSMVAIFDKKLKQQYEENKIKEKRMEEALKDIRSMSADEFATRMEQLRKSQYQEERKDEAGSQAVKDVRIVCKKCKRVAGNLSDVYRYMINHYITIDAHLDEKVTITRDEGGDTIDAMTESGILVCQSGSCSILGKTFKIRIGSYVRRMVAKWELKNVSFMGDDGKPRNRTKWQEVRAMYAIPDIMHEDLLAKANNDEMMDCT